MCGAGSSRACMQVHEWVSECVSEWMCVCVCVCVCGLSRARAFLAVIELLFSSVLKVGFYIMKWYVIYKCVCVLNFYFAYLSLRHRTIFYIATLLILMACVCVCVCMCACVHACALVLLWVCAFGCCFVTANGLLVDVCQCCCLLMFVWLPLSRHFPCCKTSWIKNLNLR